MSPLVLRLEKGSELTLAEMDNNLVYLENLALGITTTTTTITGETTTTTTITPTTTTTTTFFVSSIYETQYNPNGVTSQSIACSYTATENIYTYNLPFGTGVTLYLTKTDMVLSNQFVGFGQGIYYKIGDSDIIDINENGTVRSLTTCIPATTTTTTTIAPDVCYSGVTLFDVYNGGKVIYISDNFALIVSEIDVPGCSSSAGYNTPNWAGTGFDGCKTWSEAVAFVSGLSMNGYNDWRLPTVAEMEFIFTRQHPGLYEYEFSYYWTSEEDIENPDNAWASKAFSPFVTTSLAKTYNFLIRPVRSNYC